MKIIGPRAIVGPRRQTRIERLPLCSLRGEGVDVSPSERINGGRRASELRFGRPRNAKGRRLVLEPPRERELHSRPALWARASVGTDVTTHSRILAERRPPRNARPAGEARSVHATSGSPWGTDDTHRRSRPRSRHPPRGTGRVEHRNERGPTSRFVVCRVLPGDVELRPCCDGRELGESSECVPSDEGVPRARNRNPISSCFVL